MGWGGGGGIWGVGAMPKNMASKGGPAEKIWCVKGGTKNNTFKLGGDSICSNANIDQGQKAKTSVSKVVKIQTFPGESAPGPPTLFYTQRQLYPTNCFIRKYSQGNVNSFWLLLVWFFNNWTTDNSV